MPRKLEDIPKTSPGLELLWPTSTVRSPGRMPRHTVRFKSDQPILKVLRVAIQHLRLWNFCVYNVTGPTNLTLHKKPTVLSSGTHWASVVCGRLLVPLFPVLLGLTRLGFHRPSSPILLSISIKRGLFTVDLSLTLSLFLSLEVRGLGFLGFISISISI